MAGLTDDDKEYVRLVAREIAFAVFREGLPMHVQTCVWGQKINRIKWIMIGIGIGVPLGTAGLTVGILKFFPKIAAVL